MKRLALACLFLLPQQALATACPDIAGDTARLLCYDMEARAAELVASTVTAEPIATVATPSTVAVEPSKDEELPTPPYKGFWMSQTDKSDFKDTQDIYLHLTSKNSVNCRSYGNPEPVRLWLRCKENTTSLFLATKCHVASGHNGYGNVEYRIDDQKARKRGFQASSDNEALGLWSGRGAIPFIKSMIGGKEMIFRFTPYGSSPVTAKFEIKGIDEVIKPLRKECGW